MTPRTSLAFLVASAFLQPLAGCVAVIDVGTNDHLAAGVASGAGAGVGGGASSSTSSASGSDGAGVGGGVPVCVPSPENCATPIDENCDGVVPDCSGAHLWSKRFGDADEQTGVRVATDKSGSVYLAGTVRGTIDLGGGSLKAGAQYGVFLAKLDGKGSYVWSKVYVGSGDALVGDLAVDDQGSVYMAGNFATTIDLGTGSTLTGAGGTDLYLARIDAATGSTTWAKRYGDAGNVTPRGLAIDGQGNVLMTGYYTGGIDFGNGPLTSAGGDDIFIAKINGAGVAQWSNRYGDKDYQEAYGIAVDAAGNVVIAGNLGGSATFGSTTLTSAGGYDAFVAKLDPSGVSLWAKRFGEAGSQTAMSVGIDTKGSILLTGTMGSTIDLGGGAVNGTMFAAKIDGASGAHQWSKGYSAGLPQDLAVDGVGNVVIVGAFTGTLDPSIGQPLTSAGIEDAFAIKIDGANGASLWAHRYGDASDQAAFGVAVDYGASVFLTGSVEGAIDFGGNALKSAGGRDAWVAKLAP